MAKTVKLADIAKRLEVSVVTVSNALSGQKGVSEAVRQQIVEIAEEMGYQGKNMSVQRKKRKVCVGVVVAERFLNRGTSFYWALYQELTKIAQRAKCFVMFEVLTNEDEENEVMSLFLREEQVDGLIILGQLNNHYLEYLKKHIRFPMVCLDFYAEDIHMDAIISNNFYGMYQMTNYLIDEGHRKIYYVGTVLANSSITDRCFGYQKALLEHGIKWEPSWIIPDRDIQDGVINVKLPEELPTAFVCNCDLVACDVVRALQDKGYEVPNDISVVGFDNFFYEGYCDVEITTHEVDMKKMAQMAIERILYRLEHPLEKGSKASLQIAMGRMIIKKSVRRIGNQKNI